MSIYLVFSNSENRMNVRISGTVGFGSVSMEMFMQEMERFGVFTSGKNFIYLEPFISSLKKEQRNNPNCDVHYDTVVRNFENILELRKGLNLESGDEYVAEWWHNEHQYDENDSSGNWNDYADNVESGGGWDCFHD